MAAKFQDLSGGFQAASLKVQAGDLAADQGWCVMGKRRRRLKAELSFGGVQMFLNPSNFLGEAGGFNVPAGRTSKIFTGGGPVVATEARRRG